VTLADLDRDLDRLRAAVAHAGANLVALEQDPTVALLDLADLRGTSAERWAAARVGLADLFESYRALGSVVDRATVLRGSSRWSAATRTHELTDLLRGRSVVVTGASVALVDRPLLASSRAATTWTPTSLLEQMASSFDEIRAVVAAAARTWDVGVARTSAMRRRVAALVDPGALPASSRARLEADLAAVAAEVLADPMDLDWSRLDRLEADVAAIERDNAAAGELRDDLATTMAEARATLDDVIAAVGTATDAVARARTRIVVPPGLTAIAPIDDLTADLERIADAAAAGRWSEAASALVAWRIAAGERRSCAQACADAHEALLLDRAELRGRLDAYRAKADREGRLEDPLVTCRYERAHDALHVAPTDLAAATELVRRYQEALASPQALPSGDRR